MQPAMTASPQRPIVQRLLPTSATPDASVLLSTRSIRAFGDGLVSTILPGYLALVGLSNQRVGLVSTAMLLGSAAVTLSIGLGGSQWRRNALLQTLAIATIVSGVAFSLVNGFAAAFIIGAISTINPTSGDVSAFLPAEQALLPTTVSTADRTRLFARSNVLAFSLGALGALTAAAPGWLAIVTSTSELRWLRAAFVVYGALGAVAWWRYRRLSAAIERPADQPRIALGDSKQVVYRLAAVFSLDSLAGGFVVQSMLVIWLRERHGLSTGQAGGLLAAAGLASGFSALAAPALAQRIGLIRTMAFTHLPANILLMLAAFAPNAPMAIALLLARACLSQMDVPARQSLVMSVVQPAERPAAAAVTNVPRSLAAALTPAAAGWMLDQSTFGWPLLIGGAGKALYDIVLLLMFRHLDENPPTS
jgi:MFS family permease